MNSGLKQDIHNAVNQIQQLSSDKIQTIKAEFDKIHQNTTSIAESWLNLIKGKLQDHEDDSRIANAFLQLGSLIGPDVKAEAKHDAYQLITELLVKSLHI